MLLLILVGVGSYAAGIFTMAVVLQRRELARPLDRAMIPTSEPMPPPRQRGEPPCASPYAPRPRPPAAKPPAPVERPRRKAIHWPIARAEKDKPPPMIEVEPKPRAALPPPKPTIATSIALPDVEFGRGP